MYKYLAYASGYLVLMRDLEVVEGFVEGLYGERAKVMTSKYVVLAYPRPWCAPVRIAADLGKQRPGETPPLPAFPFAASDTWGNDG